jgi:hypothetical protein
LSRIPNALAFEKLSFAIPSSIVGSTDSAAASADKRPDDQKLRDSGSGVNLHACAAWPDLL